MGSTAAPEAQTTGVERPPPGVTRPRLSLRLKLAALAVALATIPPALVGLRLIDVNAEAVELLSREVQLAAVSDVAREIDREFVEAQDALNALGRVLTDDQLPEEQVLELALALVESAEVIDHAAVYDAQGALIDVIREEEAARQLDLPQRLSPSQRTQASAANGATGRPVLVDGAPRVLVLVPLRAGGRETGFTASLISLRDVQRRVERVAEARFRGAPGSVYVVDEDLRVLAEAGGARSSRLASAASEPLLEGAGALLTQGRLDRSGEYADAGGRPMLGSVTALAGRPWAVVAQVPREEAYASLRQMRRVVIETVLAAVVVALLLGLALAGRITSPLAKLTRFAHELSARRFDATVEVATQDELALLAQAMTGAARDLKESEARLTRELAIRSDLGRYLPEELVEQIVRREREVLLGGERRQITVLFADVVAFTPLTESRPPEEVVTILNELFTILTGIVFRHGGTVDKFIGDCVMALWGAPTAAPDHAARALAAAEDMLRWLETGNTRWQERHGLTLRLAIGVHSGEAVVGNVGSETRMAYTAIGDVVNIAARLEALARPQQILVSDDTRRAAGEGFEFVDAGEHLLAGLERSLQLWEVRV